MGKENSKYQQDATPRNSSIYAYSPFSDVSFTRSGNPFGADFQREGCWKSAPCLRI